MRLKEEQIDKLAERITTDLNGTTFAVFIVDKAKVRDMVKDTIKADLKAEEDLEREAEQLLERTLRASGGGEEIDRHKMLKLIKSKLAKERKMVL
jgi:hypothetical protein